MAVDIVSLVYAADARQLTDAEKAFDRLTAAATRNDAAERKRLTATERAGVTMRRVADETVRATRAATDHAKAQGAVERATRDAERAAQQALAFQVRMARQRGIEEAKAAREALAAQKAADRESERSAQQLLQFRVRMAKQRAAEEARAAREQAAAVASLEARIDALKGSIDPTYMAQKRLNAEMQEAAALYKMGAISASDYAKAVGILDHRMDEASRRQNGMNVVHGAGAKAARLHGHELANLGSQFADIGVSLASGQALWLVAIQQGAQIGGIYGSAAARGATLSGVLGQLAGTVGRLVAPFLKVAGVIGVFVTGLALMHRELSKRYPDDITKGLGLTAEQMEDVKHKTVTFGDTFQATMEVAGKYLMQGPLGQAINWIGDKLRDLATWTQNTLGKVFFEAAAIISGSLIGAFKVVEQNWRNFPAVMGDLVIQGMNAVVKGIEGAINKAIEGVNKFAVQAAATLLGGPLGPLIGQFLKGAGVSPNIKPISLGSIANPYQGAASFTGRAAAATISNEIDTQRNTLQKLGNEISARAIEIAQKKARAEAGAAKAVKEHAAAMSEAEKAAKRAAEELARYIGKLEEELATYGMNAQQLRTYTSLLQIEAALKLGDLASAKRVAVLTDELNALDKLNDELKEHSDIIKKIADADFKPTTEAMQEIADALKGAQGPAERLLEIFDNMSYAAEGIVGAFKSGNFSGIARDFMNIKEGLKGFSKLDFSSKVSTIAGIADGIGQAVGGKAGRALSGAATGAQLGSMIMPGIGTAVGAIVGALTTFLGGKKSNEGAGFDLRTGALSGGSRTAETEAAARSVGGAVKAGQDALRAAGLNLTETIDGIVIGTRDQSQIYTSLGKTLRSAVGDTAAAAEAALQQVLTSATFLDVTQEKLVRSMQATGKSFDEINASLAEYAAAQGMIKSVNDAILQLTDPQAFDLEMVKRAYADQVKAAETARDAGYLTTTQFDELTAALARLNGLQIDDVMSRYGDDAMEILRGTLQAAYEADAAALQEQASAYRQFADSLKGYSDQIRGAMIDTLSPGQQLGATSRRFQNVASLAAQGDKGALGQFQGAAEAFRAASAQFSPDAATNRRNLAAIQRATQDAYDAAQSQVDYAEQQLAVLQGQVAPILGDIRTNTLTTAQALQAYLAASKAKAGGGDPVQAAVASLAAGGPTAGAADPFNAAAYLAANKDLVKAGFTEEQAAAHYYGTGQYEIAGGFRKRGYAAGTNSASPGWAWVGEEGPELMRFRGGEQVVPNHALNDNGRSAAAIERQNQLLEQQNRLLMENTRQAKKTADLLQRVTRDGESLVTVAA